MTFLEKIRNLPGTRKKIIFWSLIIIIGLGLLLLYFKNIQNNIKKLKSINFKEELKMPDFSEGLKDLPKIEMPKISEDYNPPATLPAEGGAPELKKIEEETTATE